ncbi:MAG: efflux transporter outer membrane subunit [Rhodospirillales bacterium]|nr:efflux transporter outer membrane subunit [Rhodospirillales bacterium]
MVWRKFAAFLALTSVLGGCMVGPDFKTPSPPETDRYVPDEGTVNLVSAGIAGGEAQRVVHGLDIPGQWWTVFQSPQLNVLIDRSLRANPDIASAVAALRVSQQTARAQRAALFPTVSVGGTAAQTQAPTVLSAPTADGDFVFGLFTALLSINYIPDVWGGTRRATESAEAQAESQCFLLEAAYLTLASNVVVAAITEASLRSQIQATQRIIAAQRETLGILRGQANLGAITGADVASQEAALAQAEATMPPLQKALALQRNLLATLTGSLPSFEFAERFELTDLKLPADLPLSLPARLVEQRPDIRAAEANVHAAAAQVGVAVAAQLPQINLSAVVSSQSLTLGTLFSPMVGPAAVVASGGFVQTLLDGGALQAKRRAAQALFEQAQAQYRSAVLTGFRNVADTLRALEHDAQLLKLAVDAEHASSTSLTIARRRLELGDTTYVVVLIAELTYQQALLVRIQAQANRLADTAALFQALGGGWWNRDEPTNPAQRMVCKPPKAAPSR